MTLGLAHDGAAGGSPTAAVPPPPPPPPSFLPSGHVAFVSAVATVGGYTPSTFLAPQAATFSAATVSALGVAPAALVVTAVASSASGLAGRRALLAAGVVDVSFGVGAGSAAEAVRASAALVNASAGHPGAAAYLLRLASALPLTTGVAVSSPATAVVVVVPAEIQLPHLLATLSPVSARQVLISHSAPVARRRLLQAANGTGVDASAVTIEAGSSLVGHVCAQRSFGTRQLPLATHTCPGGSVSWQV